MWRCLAIASLTHLAVFHILVSGWHTTPLPSNVLTPRTKPRAITVTLFLRSGSRGFPDQRIAGCADWGAGSDQGDSSARERTINGE